MINKTQKMETDAASQRRWEIIERALQLFAEHGYETTSMADIAAACEMTKSNFYNYFKGKKDLVHATIEWTVGDFYTEIKALDNMLAQAGPLQTMEYFLNRYMDIVKKMENAYNFLNHVAANLKKAERNYLFQTIDDVRQVFERILVAGKKSGDFRDLNEKIGSMNIMTMCNSWAQYNWFVQKTVGINRYKREQILFIMKAILN